MAVDITKTASAEIVDSIDDLLMQILLRLPIKSLMRFKSVSKHWKSLITSRQFSLLRHPGPNPAVGLFYPGRKSSEFEYIHLDVTNPSKPPFRELRFPGDTSSFWIQQSCNGLLLCSSSGNLDCRRRSPVRRCYVYNPTTNCFTKLPRPGIVNEVPRILLGVNLAFDCAGSSLYKVVCVRGSEFASDLFQIEIYSAESGAWRVSGKPFRSRASFDYGIYWNGSVHWISYECRELLYFNVNEERFGKMQLPASRIGYFGESCDHLHMIEINDTQIAFNVYEMKRDYSDWFVKYCVDLTTVAAAFPEMTYRNTLTNRLCYAFSVFSLVRGEEEDESSFLVLQISRMAIRFNLDCNTFEEICDIGDDYLVQPWLARSFGYIESLACV